MIDEYKEYEGLLKTAETKAPSKEVIVWNPEQEKVIQDLVEFISSKFDADNWGYGLMGFAGTGKTFLSQEVLKRVAHLGLSSVVTAPTNKATEVLRNFGSTAGVYVPAKTTFSLLGLVLGNNGEVRNCFQGGEGTFGNYQVVWIDEGSLAGRVITEKVKEQAQIWGVKVIVMMDQYQLNPVKEKRSNFCDTDFMPLHGLLTQPMRQDEGSPITPLVTRCRKWVETGQPPGGVEESLTEDGSGVHIITGNDYYKAMVDHFLSEEYRDNPQFCRALAWTNAEVDRNNKMIREALYGKDCGEYVVGERLVSKSPVKLHKKSNDLVLAVNDECSVVSIAQSTVEDEGHYDEDAESFATYEVWVLRLKTSDGARYVDVKVLKKKDESRFDDRLDYLRSKALKKQIPWSKYWDTVELFPKVKPAHAMTIHNSQGQTFSCVFVNTKDVRRCKNSDDRARLQYVATSRPTTDLVLNTKVLR